MNLVCLNANPFRRKDLKRKDNLHESRQINICSFTCFDQFMCMAFAQLTYRESLRDIECCLRPACADHGKWNYFLSGSNSIWRIKAFYGTSENAVKTQIWIAISVYVSGSHNQETAENRSESLHNFTDFQYYSFEKCPSYRLSQRANKITSGHIQLNLFEP